MHKKFQKIKKRPYFKKKFDVTKASNEALEVSDSFFDNIAKKFFKY